MVKEGTNKKTGEKVALKFIGKKYVDDDDIQVLKAIILVLNATELDSGDRDYEKDRPRQCTSHTFRSQLFSQVLSLKELFETTDQIVLVTELATGGELFYQSRNEKKTVVTLLVVQRESSYSEKDAKHIIRQIVLGVQYLHVRRKSPSD